MGVTDVLQALALANVVCSLIGGCLPGARPPPPAPLPVQVVRVVHRPSWKSQYVPPRPEPVKSMLDGGLTRAEIDLLEGIRQRARASDPFRQGMEAYEAEVKARLEARGLLKEGW